MATMKQTPKPSVKLPVALWLLAFATLATLLTLLTLAIKNDTTPTVDRTIIDSVSGWDVPGLAGFVRAISAATSNYPIAALVALGVAFLWLLGMSRAALAFAVVIAFAGVMFLGGDQILGDYVGRS